MLASIKAEADEHKEDPKYSWSGNKKPTVVTSYSIQGAASIFESSDLDAVITDSYNEFVRSMGAKYNLASTYRVDTLWWNCYPPSTSAPFHNHGSVSISGVYIVEQNENCPLFFESRNNYALNPFDSGDILRIKAEAGTCILFPAALHHCVDETKDWRTTLSFNFTAVE
jgi:hypothetical protein